MSTTVVRKLAVFFVRLGPYHMARLERAARALEPAGVQIAALELVRRDLTYAWDVRNEAQGFERTTLFDSYHSPDFSHARAARRLERALDKLEPAAVAVAGWALPEARAALRWCRRNGKPAILMSDSSRQDYRRRRWKEMIKRRIVKAFASALVAGTPQMEYVLELGMDRGKVFTGYNAVDNDFFEREAARARTERARLAVELGLPERFFLVVARCVPEKNLFGLLSAWQLYRQREQAGAWPLVICGDGPEAGALKQRAASGSMTEIVWPGFVQPKRLPLYYGTASAFLLASLKDSWAVSVNEAMASGLPVLVSRRAGSARDLVHDGHNGYLLDPDDPRQMAARMGLVSAMSDDDRLKMGNASGEIIAQWGLDRFATGLRDALRAAEDRP